MYERSINAACLQRDRWSASLGLLPGGRWSLGVYLKEWLFLSDQRRAESGSLAC